MATKTSKAKAAPGRAKKKSTAPKKHIGDVIGLSRARVPAHVPRATKDRGGNPKGLEVKRARSPRRAGVVGGVRSHRPR